MDYYSIPLITSFLLVFLTTSTTKASSSDQIQESFPRCVIKHGDDLFPCSNSSAFFTPESASYDTILESTAQNLRCLTPSMPKPLIIFTPCLESQVKSAVFCAKKLNIQLRTRSGGHDYEGLSYTSGFQTPSPFILIDLRILRSVNVRVQDNTAWVQSGATLGELYYRISEKSPNLGFPAGLRPSVGIGGHITGGAYGSMMRKYGLGADNVLDARIVTADGEILDRKAMGEDLFWAISGGGGGSFGIILAWKVKLVRVPSIVTVFTVPRTLEEGATKTLHRWQKVSDKLDENLFIRVSIEPANSTKPGHRTIRTSYNALFLGGEDKLLEIMSKGFPELGLTKNDCIEMSWIESVLYMSGYPRNTSLDVLLQGKPLNKKYFKAKSDFFNQVITEQGLERLWEILLEEETPRLIWNPFGGRMSEISETETPFPHRHGVIFMAQYITSWKGDHKDDANKHYLWIRRLYEYMARYAPKSPRVSYVNYRDLDLGINTMGSDDYTSYVDARKWGVKYFKGNFDRLVRVKSTVDPEDFFWHEQSIPTLPFMIQKRLNHCCNSV